ncbi:hypothetical protein N7G274_010390 [Stereocaulon virgatum]|uniref:Uncharacterized protein n=1 Tax=Stereocaulon virgatum TaxID=373712 RepID=A0ABR3ZTL1_9LECA
MSSVRTILTTQPDSEARAILYGDTSINIIWSDCRLIWDSASLVTEAAEHEACIYGAEGKYSTHAGDVHEFRLQHCYTAEPDRKYMIQITRSSADGQDRQVNVVYETRLQDGGESAFREKIRDIARVMRSDGLQKALEHILGADAVRTQVNGSIKWRPDIIEFNV